MKLLRCYSGIKTAMLHDQFPEEEGLKPLTPKISLIWDVLHDQFPEEEGLKQQHVMENEIEIRLHDQFPEEEGLKRPSSEITGLGTLSS